MKSPCFMVNSLPQPPPKHRTESSSWFGTSSAAGGAAAGAAAGGWFGGLFGGARGDGLYPLVNVYIT